MAPARKLDDAKRREICALLTAGYSVTSAANYVDCSRRTIHRELERNAEFAEKVRRAEIAGQLDPLATVRHAARSDWRAAAWYLERTNPQRFGKRNPVLIKPEDILAEIDSLVEIIFEEVKDDATCDRIVERLVAAAGNIDKAAAAHERLDGRAKPVSLDPAKQPFGANLPTIDEVSESWESGE